jgi:hypothetical protein
MDILWTVVGGTLVYALSTALHAWYFVPRATFRQKRLEYQQEMLTNFRFITSLQLSTKKSDQIRAASAAVLTAARDVPGNRLSKKYLKIARSTNIILAAAASGLNKRNVDAVHENLKAIQQADPHILVTYEDRK